MKNPHFDAVALILQQTESLCPLLAVQAIYSHPCTV